MFDMSESLRVLEKWVCEHSKKYERTAAALSKPKNVVQVNTGVNHFTNPENHEILIFSKCKINISIYEWKIDKNTGTQLLDKTV